MPNQPWLPGRRSVARMENRAGGSRTAPTRAYGGENNSQAVNCGFQTESRFSPSRLSSRLAADPAAEPAGYQYRQHYGRRFGTDSPPGLHRPTVVESRIASGHP